jgi:hypothetical protein
MAQTVDSLRPNKIRRSRATADISRACQIARFGAYDPKQT